MSYVLFFFLFSYEDKARKVKSHVRVAFQVRIKPGSYKIGPQTVGLHDQLDPYFKNEELEWSTRARGAIILTGVLVKLETVKV